jgi:hypothetical protein
VANACNLQRYTKVHGSRPLGPFARTGRLDLRGLIDQLVRGVAAMVGDLVAGAEHPVRQPVVAHEPPDVFLRVELRAFRGNGDDRDVSGRLELRRQVPAGMLQLEGEAPL